MPTATPPNTDAESAAGSATCPTELRYLRRGLLEGRGHFCLYPVESNLRGKDRTSAFAELHTFLEDAGIRLRVLTLTPQRWNLLAILDEEPPLAPDEAVLILGLEQTPEIIPILGATPRRPPALSVLNLQRESIERQLGVPTVLWCDPTSYQSLIEHAPDFFDHYTATFRLLKDYPPEEAPATTRSEEPLSRANEESRLPASPALLDFYERQLLKTANSPGERANVLIGLAEELWRLPTGDIPRQKERGLRLAREAARLYTEVNRPLNTARAQVFEGILLQDLPSGDRDANLKQAIACYQAALRVYTEADFPQDWAMTQNNLANAYSDLPSGDRDANLKQAIACYQAALRVYTEADFPQQWAMTQNNLANAYRDLPSGDRDANLKQAIACYQAALRVYTEADFPQQWATTQNNLANAYLYLPSGDRDANLKQAIACYQAALRVRTEADFPQQWAMTQNNLANAYSDLPSGDRDANLKQAIACYQAALRVRTEADFPQQWADTNVNLGLVLQAMGSVHGTRTAWANAVRGYRAVNLQEEAANIEKAIAALPADA